MLSDLISGSAQAHAEGRPEDAEALWEASARALGSAPRSSGLCPLRTILIARSCAP